MDAIVDNSVQAKRTFVQKYPLLSFFVLAFGPTWPFLIADALGSYGLIPFRMPSTGPGFLLALLMSYGPTFAALIVTGMTAGRAGIRRLLGRFLRWRVGLRWYLVTIFGVGLLFFIAWQIALLLGGIPKPLPPGGPAMLAVNLTLVFIINGVINGEELGWRGFALPRLQGKYNALVSSLILGVIWALFHLPLFFTKGGGVGGNMSKTPFPAFALSVLAGAVLMTWIFNNTRGSMLMAYLYHAAANTWSMVFASEEPAGLIFWVQAMVFSVAAVAVILVFGPDRLSRKPEGEQQFVTER